MKSVVALALVTVAVPSIASAQPGVTDPTPMPSPMVQAQVDTVDENVAIGLSLGGTAVSWALLIAGGSMDNESMATAGAIGTLFAPSLGHWYSHSVLTRGLGIRALGLGVGFVGFAMALGDALSDSESSSGNGDTGAVLALLGAAMYIAGTVDDIATAGHAARKYNSRFQNVNVVPQLSAHGGGVSLVGRF